MKENVDKLTQLFQDGRNASEQLNELFEALVPKRTFIDTMPKIGTGKYGLPYTYYPEKEPEHHATEETLGTVTTYVKGWTDDVNAVLDAVGKARYKMQFNDPKEVGAMFMHGELTPNESAMMDVLYDFGSRLGELRKIIIDYETTGEKAIATTATIAPATYDKKTSTLSFAGKDIRFKKNAPFTPALCDVIFSQPDKLWLLKDLQKVWDSQYDYLPERITDWHRVYEAINRINMRIYKQTDIDNLFVLSTTSVRLNGAYLSDAKKSQ